MHIRWPSLLVASLVLLPAAAQQPPQVYNVELVVFRAASSAGTAENWALEPAPAATASDAQPSASEQAGRVLRALPDSQFQMNDVENKLRSTGAYVPVAHVAWSQTASAWGSRIGLPLDRVGLNAEGLSGTVSLERGQYLHLILSLTYAMPTPPPGIGAEAGTPFTINESRRVRFYERNYYDHPAFGVIALVTPATGSRPAAR